MYRTCRRAAASSLLAGGVALVGPIAVAQATDATLRATVKSDIPRITRSQAKILNGEASLQQSNSPKALIKAISAQDRNLKALRAELSREAPSSATGAKAKRDMVAGLKLIVGSNTTLSKDLVKNAKGEKVSKAQLKAAVARDIKGSRDLNTGAKLLKA